MGKRYEVVKSYSVDRRTYVAKTTVCEYKIHDNALDSIICICDTSEQADLIVRAMNKTYKVCMINKRGIDVTI